MTPATYPASALLLALAMAAALRHVGGPETVSLALALLLMLALLLPTTAREDGGVVADTSPTVPVTLASGSLLALSAWLLLMPRFSELPGTSATVGWIIAALPLGYLAAQRFRDAADWEAALSLLRVVATLVLAIGLVDFLLLRSRPFSVFEDVNAFAAFCNVFAVTAIAGLETRRRADGLGPALRSGTAAFALLALACLAATASRGGQLSFALGITVLGLLLIRRDRRAWTTLAASLLAFVALLALIAPLQQHTSALSRLAAIEGDGSTRDRLEMLKSTWRMVEDGPWYGSGLGTYKIRYLMYRSPDEQSTTGDLAHNDYLQMLAEGGPLLAGLLVLLGLSAVAAAIRLWRNAAGGAATFGEAAGWVAALACLFGHAALNFIFYVLPLSLLAGLALGRLDALRDDVARIDPGRYLSGPMQRTLIGVLALWLAGTQGLQGVYQAMTTGRCPLRLCTQLAGDEPFFGRYSALLVATQPDYLPAREWLVNAYSAAADKPAAAPPARAAAARQAAQELAEQIARFPAVPYLYRDLASLLIRHPDAAAALPAGIERQPIALLREAVRRNPLDMRARTMLAERLDADGQTAAAFTLLDEDGMRWWNVQALPDSGRIELLKTAIPLALKLRRCSDAAEMARGLAVFQPGEPLAQPIAGDGPDCDPPATPAAPH
ncbi:O-antigen ligase family protein [Nevskia sp.]|uniref:O-antigen ligase family protein n=1 Tax=Nevskia sp. TaxID=1929292 RepID=UPI003F730B7B